MIGTDEQQAYMKDYRWNLKGYSYLEPGVVSTDSKYFAALNVAKSFYKVYPEVFNLRYISQKTGLDPQEIRTRLQRMYDERLLMLVKNSCVGAMGFGLYYWVCKLRDDISPEEREEMVRWMQENDQICTG